MTVLLQRARDAETQATLAKVKAAHDRDRAVRKEAEAKVAADEAESRRAQEKAEKGRAERASFEAKSRELLRRQNSYTSDPIRETVGNRAHTMPRAAESMRENAVFDLEHIPVNRTAICKSQADASSCRRARIRLDLCTRSCVKYLYGQRDVEYSIVSAMRELNQQHHRILSLALLQEGTDFKALSYRNFLCAGLE
jgi:hypothetical protein